MTTTMTTRSVALLLFLLIPAAASAQTPVPAERPSVTTTFVLPTAALVGGAVFDVVSTQRAFARGCSEGNTMLYTAHPETARLLTVKAATAGAAVAAMWFAHKSGHPTVARWLGYAAGGATTTAGILNTVNACH